MCVCVCVDFIASSYRSVVQVHTSCHFVICRFAYYTGFDAALLQTADLQLQI
jgi:hypothetical protein